MNRNSIISAALLIATIFLGCSKKTTSEPTPVEVITVSPPSVSNIRAYNAQAEYAVTSSSTGNTGLCVGTAHNPDTSMTDHVDDHFVLTLNPHYHLINLTPGTTYYTRHYALTQTGIIYSAETSFRTTDAKLTLHEDYAGGTVIYIDASGKHGIVGYYYDLSEVAPWMPRGNTSSEIFSTAREVGKGKANTNKLIAVFGKTTDHAAARCVSLKANGYSDWFLPSISELELVWSEMYVPKVGEFKPATNYWSSTTSVSSAHAYKKNWPSGSWLTEWGEALEGLRACRAF